VTSKDGHEYLDDDDDSHYETIFIISDFERNIFHELKQTHIRILGPPVIAAVVQTNKVSVTPFPCPFLAKLHSCLFIFCSSFCPSWEYYTSVPAGTEV